MGGIEATKRLVAKHPQVRILALSAHEDTSYSKRAFQAGALGYLSKRTAPEVLIDAIRLVARGKRFIDPGIAQRMAMQDLSGEADPLAVLSPREFEVRMERPFLFCARRVVAKEVEPGFADGDDLGMAGGFQQRAAAQILVGVGLVRVDADTRKNIRLARGGADYLVPLGLAGRDVEEGPHPRGPGAFEHALTVLDQAFVFQMTMAIDQHHASSAGSSSRGNSGVGAMIW
jgi:hypothetical protein